jgi:hypothetical protein
VSVDAAVDSLLGSQRSSDRRAGLIKAAKEAMRRREQNTHDGVTCHDGGAVITALVELYVAVTLTIAVTRWSERSS